MDKKFPCCDSCGETHDHAVIIEKPSRFAFQGKKYDLVAINNDGRQTDIYCLKCLEEEIESIRNCY